jgi:hypothetical protein
MPTQTVTRFLAALRGPMAPIVALALLLAGCATAGGGPAKDGITGLGPADVTGGMLEHPGGDARVVTRAAAFGPNSVAVTAGAAHSARLDRTPAGTWRGGVGPRSGARDPGLIDIELSFAEGRITGPSVNVRYTPVPGGFRLEGLWLGDNVSLEVTSTYAQVRSDRWVRDAGGSYVSPLLSTVEFLGEAGRLDTPTMPQMALMVLLFGWGVR